MEYNKLVRDNIPDIIRSENKEPVFHEAAGAEYEQKLSEKLREEVSEFLSEFKPEELADVMEVILAIAESKGMNLAEVEKIRKEKREERGGFVKKIILESA